MSGLVEVLNPGMGATLQDPGRLGHRHQGVPWAGWLDAPLAQAANALAGNAGHEAVVELRGQGPALKLLAGPVQVALAGAVKAKIHRVDGQTLEWPAWQSQTLQTGDHLQLGWTEDGCAYLAVAGGWREPAQLGSRATYTRAGLNGLLGRAWQSGDLLHCETSTGAAEWRSAPWQLPDGPIRLLLGPQQDHFTQDAVALLLNEPWQATNEQDRMGLRLAGPILKHAHPGAADTISDAVAPGAIQVPANGQPIVLLADSQTVGGYPKIASVITADLPKLAHWRPGQAMRFAAVTRAQALKALLEQRAAWQRWLGTRQVWVPPGFVDETALYGSNLVSGLVRAEA